MKVTSKQPFAFVQPTLSRLMLGGIGLLALTGVADDRSYYERFLAALTPEKEHIISDSALVDTKNAGPVLTNLSVSFRKFSGSGELAGVRLGMSMSEVVAAWGKPRLLYSRCRIGPRLWYGGGRGLEGLSLSFKGDRLVLIAISGATAQDLRFDNGLKVQMDRAACERVLGTPTLRDLDRRRSLYVGDIAYRSGGLRTDLGFKGTEEGRPPSEPKIAFISVRLESEAEIEKTGETTRPANGSQPLRLKTNSTSSAPDSRR